MAHARQSRPDGFVPRTRIVNLRIFRQRNIRYADAEPLDPTICRRRAVGCGRALALSQSGLGCPVLVTLFRPKVDGERTADPERQLNNSLPFGLRRRGHRAFFRPKVDRCIPRVRGCQLDNSLSAGLRRGTGRSFALKLTGVYQESGSVNLRIVF